MSKASLEKVVANAVALLAEFLPQKTYLYTPLLSASLVWAFRRAEDWESKILAWRIWPSPRSIAAKPDAFVLSFFNSRQSLREAYKNAVKRKDFDTLRPAFLRLYPLLGLEDPFLTALFQEELKAGDYKKIAAEFEERLERAKKDIRSVHGKSRLLQGLRTFAEEMLDLGASLLSQAKVESIIAKAVREYLEEQVEK